MGVQHLWELLAPVGRKADIETLAGKKLAIDTSIWLIQFMKAMRDDSGEMIHNAHLLGLLHRICKLLTYKIKPVFVFDGSTPDVKLRTTARRRRQRDRAEATLKRLAERLLMNRLQQAAIGQNSNDPASQASGGGFLTAEEKKQIARITAEKDVYSQFAPTGKAIDDDEDEEGRGKSGGVADQSQTSLHMESDQEYISDMDEYEAIQTAIRRSKRDLGELEDTEEGVDADEEAIVRKEEEEIADDIMQAIGVQELLTGKGDIDLDFLSTLPPEMQYNILLQIKEMRIHRSRSSVPEMVDQSLSNFSGSQVSKFLKHSQLSKKFKDVKRQMASQNMIKASEQLNQPLKQEEKLPNPQSGGGSSNQATTAAAAGGFLEEEENESQPAANNKPSLGPLMIQQAGRIASEENREYFIAKRVGADQSLATLSALAKEPEDPEKEKQRKKKEEQEAAKKKEKERLQQALRGSSSASGYYSNVMQIGDRSKGPDFIRKGPLSASNPSSSGSAWMSLRDLTSGSSSFEQPQKGKKKTQPKLLPSAPSSVSAASSILPPIEDISSYVSCAAFLREPVSSPKKPTLIAPSSSSASSSTFKPVAMDDIGLPADVLEEARLAEVQFYSRQENEKPKEMIDLDKNEAVEDEDDDDEFETVDIDAMLPSFWHKLNDGKKAESEVIILDNDDEEEEEEEMVAIDVDAAAAAMMQSPPPRSSSATASAAESPLDVHAMMESFRSKSPGHLFAMNTMQKDEERARVRDEDEEVEEKQTANEPSSALKWSKSSERRPNTPVSRRAAIEPRLLWEQAPPTIIDSDDEVEEVEESSIQKEKPLPAKKPTYVSSSPSPPPPLSAPTLATAPAAPPPSALSALPTLPSPASLSPSFVKAPMTEAVKANLPLAPSAVEPVTNASPKAAVVETPVEQQPEQEEDDDWEAVPVSPAPRLIPSISSSLPVPISAPISSPVPAPVPTPPPSINQPLPPSAPLPSPTFVAPVPQPQLPPSSFILPPAPSPQKPIYVSEQERRDAQSSLEAEERSLQAAANKAGRDTDMVTSEMLQQVRELLDLFGIPYIQAPEEADAQCGFLNAAGLVDGVITEDSDVFLFGAKVIYKNMFDQSKLVEIYDLNDIEKNLGLDRNKLIELALLLGSDYTDGVRNVGIVTAMEILNAFSGGTQGLQEFKEWVYALDTHAKPDGASEEEEDEEQESEGEEESEEETEESSDENESSEEEVVERATRRKSKKIMDLSDNDTEEEAELNRDDADYMPEKKKKEKEKKKAAKRKKSTKSPKKGKKKKNTKKPKRRTPKKSEGGEDAVAVEGLSAEDKARLKAMKSFKQRFYKTRRHFEFDQDFPSDRVIHAYLEPRLDRSLEPFSWAQPDLNLLRSYTEEQFGWTRDRADPILVPVVENAKKGYFQTRVDAFFLPGGGNRVAQIRSKRIHKAIMALTGNKSNVEVVEEDAVQQKSKRRKLGTAPAPTAASAKPKTVKAKNSKAAPFVPAVKFAGLSSEAQQKIEASGYKAEDFSVDDSFFDE